MKFLGNTLIGFGTYIPGGEAAAATARLDGVVDTAVWAEQLGYDAFGVGERHNPDFLSSAPPVVLANIAARTSTIRLVTTVTVLSLLDPVRVAEDYATLDHLSHGRLDLIIGKGNDEIQPALFGATLAEQWDRNAENYALLRRLWREEKVTWAGKYRPALTDATTRPRPYQQPSPRVWHGSASSELSTELAAKYGDPVFSANGFHPVEKYVALINHYRERWEFYGHPPERALVGVGAGTPIIAKRSQDAFDAVRPAWDKFKNSPGARHNQFPFQSIEEHAARGSLLVGSPAQITERLLEFHELFGNEVLGIGVEGLLGQNHTQNRANLELFFAEVAPELRAQVPSRPWESLTALGGEGGADGTGGVGSAEPAVERSPAIDPTGVITG